MLDRVVEQPKALVEGRAIERKGPTALVLTRQAVPQQPRTPAQLDSIRRGGYVLIDCTGVPEALVIATGSEVGIAAQAVSSLNEAGRRADESIKANMAGMMGRLGLPDIPGLT